jgi:hypothetical protein
MWKMFLSKHPDVKISYTFFWTFYRNNFNFRIGQPQVKSAHLSEAVKRGAVAELIVHKRQSKYFYSMLDSERNNPNRNNNVLSISFDYMKTTSLPKIPVQDLYYLRQLSCNTGWL